MARKKRMKKRARGGDGREGGEMGARRGEEGKEWRREKRERRSGKEGWVVEGEESQGGEGRDWHEKTWEGVKKIENAMPRRHVYQGTQEVWQRGKGVSQCLERGKEKDW